MKTPLASLLCALMLAPAAARPAPNPGLAAAEARRLDTARAQAPGAPAMPAAVARADAHVSWAQALEQQGQPETASKHFSAAHNLYRAHPFAVAQLDADSLIRRGEASYGVQRYAEALGYFEPALRLQRKAQNRRGEAESLINIGDCLWSLRQPAAALQKYHAALQVARELRLGREEGEALGRIGVAQRSLGRPEEALKYFEQSLAWWRKLSDGRREAMALLQSGLSRAEMEHHQAALGLFQDALKLARAQQDRANQAAILSNIAASTLSLGHGERALALFEQSLRLWIALRNRAGASQALLYLGIISNQLGRHHSASKYLQRARPILHALKDRAGEAIALHDIGYSHAGMGRYLESLQSYELSLSLFRSLADRAGEARVLRDSAAACAHLNRYQEAVRRYELARAVEAPESSRLPQQAARSSGRTEALGKAGEEALRAGDHARAVAYLESAVLAKPNAGWSEPLAGAHLGWAMALEKLDRVAEAIGRGQRALELFRADRNRKRELLLLRLLASFEEKREQGATALRYLQLALPLAQALGDRVGEGGVLNSMAQAWEGLGRTEEAVRFYVQAREVFRATKFARGEASVLSSLGHAYDRLSRHQEALASNQAALPLFAQLKDAQSQGYTLHKIGFNLGALARYEEALAYHREALELARTTGDQKAQAVAQQTIAYRHESLTQYPEALSHHRQALLLQQQIRDRVGESTSLNSLGLVYGVLGRTEESLKYLSRGLVIRRQIGDRLGESMSLTSLGYTHARARREARAIGFYRQALAIARERRDRLSQALALNSIGSAHNALGQFQRARSYLLQALALYREERAGGGEASALSNLGRSATGQGRHAEAVGLYHRALLLQARSRNRRAEAMTLDRVMRARAALRQSALAIFYGKQAVNTLQEMRGRIQSLDQETQQSFAESNQDTYRTLAGLLIEAGRLPEAEQVLRLLKQHEFFLFARRDAARSGASEPTALTPQEAEWDKRYSEISEQATTIGTRLLALQEKKKRGRSEAEEREFQALQKDQEAINGRFALFLRELGGSLQGRGDKVREVHESQGWQARLAELERRDGERAAVLYTLAAPDRFRVILLTAGTRQAFEFPISEAALNARVAALRAALTNPRADPRPAAQAMHQALFCKGRVERALAGAKIETALWFLDGSLRYVPISAVHDGSKYLAQAERTNVVITLASEKRGFEKPEGGGEMLGLGVSQPHQVQVGSGPASERIGFGALASVPDELRGIIRNEKRNGVGPMPGEILLDPDFTAATLREALGEGYRTVHIASHFNLKAGDEAASFLLLGDGQPLPMLQWQTQMNLGSVDLLTLSACETALAGAGKTAGGGAFDGVGSEVDSLGEVTQRLGAASVIASLWPVADKSTAQLMRAFYLARAERPGLGKAHALREAQLALLNGHGGTGSEAQVLATASSAGSKARGSRGDESAAGEAPAFKTDPKTPFAHPYFWAPFILIGNWR